MVRVDDRRPEITHIMSEKVLFEALATAKNGKATIDASSYAIRLGNELRDSLSDDDRLRVLVGMATSSDIDFLQKFCKDMQRADEHSKNSHLQIQLLNDMQQECDGLADRISAARSRSMALRMEFDKLVVGVVAMESEIVHQKNHLTNLRKEKEIVEADISSLSVVVQAKRKTLASTLDALQSKMDALLSL